MKDVKGNLIERIKRTDLVESFRFLPQEKIDFLPGQFLQVIFDPENRNNKDLNKFLSFSCGPEKDYIEVSKKLTDSEFSSKLKCLRQGDEVLFKAPMGNCVFNDDCKRIAFLVGGIGVTPVISILEHITDKKSDTEICFLYSNWTKKDIAFKEELDILSEKNEKIKVVHVLVTCDAEDKGCLKGVIDKNLLESQGDDFYNRVVFIFGPPAMVGAMKKICEEMGIPKDKLRTESFIGY